MTAEWDNVTTSLFESEEVESNLTNIRDKVLKIVYIIIGIVGVLDNVFVITIFLLFIKITEKVCGLHHIEYFFKLCSVVLTI